MIRWILSVASFCVWLVRGRQAWLSPGLADPHNWEINPAAQAGRRTHSASAWNDLVSKSTPRTNRRGSNNRRRNGGECERAGPRAARSRINNS